MTMDKIERYAKEKMREALKKENNWQEHKDRLVVGTTKNNDYVTYTLYLPGDTPQAASLFAECVCDLRSGETKVRTF